MTQPKTKEEWLDAIEAKITPQRANPMRTYDEVRDFSLMLADIRHLAQQANAWAAEREKAVQQEKGGG